MGNHSFVKFLKELICEDGMKVGDKVEIVGTGYNGAIGVIIDILDNGDYINIDVEFMDGTGISNSEIFHCGELIPANLN
jgi:hypothetical protein